jgi:hypothetical protein
MGFLNTYFNQETGKVTDQGAGAINTGLNLANPFLQTGDRDDNVWNAGGTVGTTGFSNIANMGGQMAGQFGTVGMGVQGGLQSIGAMTDLFSYDPEVDRIDTRYSSNELPTFDLSDEASSVNNFMSEFKESANKKVASSTLGGAAAGTAIVPGLGTAIGAGVGFLGSMIGRSSAKDKAEDANNKMQDEYSSGIERFNKSTKGYYNKQNAAERYQANRANQRNLFNIPSSNSYFYLG